MELGVPELLLILLIIMLLFGVGRIGKIAGELGGGIKAFKDALHGDEPEPVQVHETESAIVSLKAEEKIPPPEGPGSSAG